MRLCGKNDVCELQFVLYCEAFSFSTVSSFEVVVKRLIFVENHEIALK